MASHIVERTAAAAKRGPPNPHNRRSGDDDPAVGALVHELFPPDARGLTCFFTGPAAGAAKSRRPPGLVLAFDRPARSTLEGEAVHAVFEPVEDPDPLAAARRIAVGGLLRFLLWPIAASVFLAVRHWIPRGRISVGGAADKSCWTTPAGQRSTRPSGACR
jgi:hypothetical protein